MPELVHKEPFDFYGDAYRAMGDAVQQVQSARSAMVQLEGEPGEDEFASALTDSLRIHQRELAVLRGQLYERAKDYGQLVLLRPVPGRIVKRFNDLIDASRPSGARSEGLVFDACLAEVVIAPCDGTVIQAGVLGGLGSGGVWGKRVAIDAGDETVVWVAHLDAVDVKAGDVVKAGATVIGRAGESGNAAVTQVLLVLQRPDGLRYPGLSFPIADPWPPLFDKRDDDAIYLEEAKVEG